MDFEEIKNKAKEIGIIVIEKALILLAIFIISYLLIKLVLFLLNKTLSKTKIEKAALKYLLNVVKFILYMCMIFAMAQVIGISVTAFIAVLSAVGLALSLALQDTLGNFASGVIMVFTKPFKANDYIRVAAEEGSVKEIKLMYTVLVTSDNKVVSIPNKKIINSELTNFTTLETKKIILTFLVAYNSDIDKIKETILNVIASNKYVLITPPPSVIISSFTQHGINIALSCWCNSGDLAEVKLYLTENVFNEFKREGISLAYEKLEVLLKQEEEKLSFSGERPLALPMQQHVQAKKSESSDFADNLFTTLTAKEQVTKIVKKVKDKKSKKKEKDSKNNSSKDKKASDIE